MAGFQASAVQDRTGANGDSTDPVARSSTRVFGIKNVAPDSALRAPQVNTRALAAEVTPLPTHGTSEVDMKRVTGIGGIFFKAKDAPALQAWYKRHLAIDVQEWGGTAFTWADSDGKPTAGTTIWSIGPEEGGQFAPSKASFMVNYRVDDLHAVVAALKAEGCNVLDKIDDSEYGKFAWVIDPEGNKVELWEPPAGQ